MKNNVKVIFNSSSIGVIIPPQEIRTEINMTAKYVAKHGIEFEKKIIENESNNPKFSFINKDDPYRSYYDQRVRLLINPFVLTRSASIIL